MSNKDSVVDREPKKHPEQLKHIKQEPLTTSMQTGVRDARVASEAGLDNWFYLKTNY